MKFKLDENFDWKLAAMVADGGHEADTVKDEQLSGKPDEMVYEACVTDGRVLITLDLDFANPFRFPPAPTAGIVVVRPARPVLSLIRDTLAAALPTLKASDLRGSLWIVEPGRMRVYDPDKD